MRTALKGGLVIVYMSFIWGPAYSRFKASEAIRRLLVSYNGAYEEYMRHCPALLCSAMLCSPRLKGSTPSNLWADLEKPRVSPYAAGPVNINPNTDQGS